MLITFDVPDDLATDFFANVPKKSQNNLQVFLKFLTEKQPSKTEESLDLPFPTLNRTQTTVSNEFINQLREQGGI